MNPMNNDIQANKEALRIVRVLECKAAKEIGIPISEFCFKDHTQNMIINDILEEIV